MACSCVIVVSRFGTACVMGGLCDIRWFVVVIFG